METNIAQTARDAGTLITLSAESTIHGEERPVSIDGSIRADGACVGRSHIEAFNGVPHVIDRVLRRAAI